MRRDAWLALLILVPFAVGGCTPSYIALRREASRTLTTDSEEYFMGRAVAAQLLSQYSLYQNATVTEYVNAVGQTVTRKSPRPNPFRGYRFAVLDTQEINSFACPGGIIFITRGMIQTCKDEDQLAAVLAHEVSHVINKDGVNSIRKSRRAEATADLVNTFQPLPWTFGLLERSVKEAILSAAVNGYGRPAEEAADAGAVATLTAAGYNPGAVAAMLTSMLAKDTGAAGGIYKTHPPTSERLAKLKTSVGQSPESKFEKIRTERFKKMVL